MTIKTQHNMIEFYGFDSFFLSIFGIEVFKAPGERITVSRKP